MKSPKTTAVAVLTIIAAVAKLAIGVVEGGALADLSMEDIGLLLVGIGFFFTRDRDRTDVEDGADVAAAKRELRKIEKEVDREGKM